MSRSHASPNASHIAALSSANSREELADALEAYLADEILNADRLDEFLENYAENVQGYIDGWPDLDDLPPAERVKTVRRYLKTEQLRKLRALFCEEMEVAGGAIRLYRGLRVSDEQPLDAENLGMAWSYTRRGAQSYCPEVKVSAQNLELALQLNIFLM